LQRADVFGPDKLWNIHLRLGAKEYQALQPKGGGFGFPFGKKDNPPPKKIDEEKPKDPAEKPDVHKNKAFGLEFPWVKGALEFEVNLGKQVGFRYKGNSPYQMSQQGWRRPFKAQITHFDADQKLHGMHSFSRGNGVPDSPRIREALAFSVFRPAKAPA